MRGQIKVVAWPHLLGSLSWLCAPTGYFRFKMIAHQPFDFIRQGAQDPGGAVRPVVGNQPQQERPAGLLRTRNSAMPLMSTLGRCESLTDD